MNGCNKTVEITRKQIRLLPFAILLLIGFTMVGFHATSIIHQTRLSSFHFSRRMTPAPPSSKTRKGDDYEGRSRIHHPSLCDCEKEIPIEASVNNVSEILDDPDVLK